MANIECLLRIALADSDEHIRQLGGEQELLNLMNGYYDLMERFKANDSEWIPADLALPADNEEDVLICVEDDEGSREVYKGFFEDNEWWSQWCCGCKRLSEEKLPHKVVAWMPPPKVYREPISRK